VEAALAAAADGPVYALGPLAHNEPLLGELAGSGVVTVDSLAQVPEGSKVIIRTHGASPETLAEAAGRNLKLIDATCPYVKKLQQLVEKLVSEGKDVIIAGDRLHPEVQALVAWGGGRPRVAASPEEAERLILTSPVALVAQTTQRRNIVDEIGEKLKAKVPVVEIYNTICQATARRQEAASNLAGQVDVMVVVGGKASANTRKLAEICSARGVKTILVTEAGELDTGQLGRAKAVGVTAGASTPDWTIKEVIGKMEEEKGTVMPESREAAERNYPDRGFRDFSVGDEVKGVVVKADEDEALVDIGYKSEGILPRQEMITEPDQLLTEALQPGQELELVVKSVDRREGKIILSRRVVERKQKWQELERAFSEGTVLTGKVREAVPAGMVIDLGGGFEGFMPGSMVDVRYIPDFSEFLNQQVSFKVIELRREKEKVILSRKQVLEEQSARQKEKTLNSLQEGQIIRGTVKRLTNFGAFVDVGGIDGLVHISEISWHRIEHPSEVLSVGDEIAVKVIEVVPERERIGLSLRQAKPDPWSEITSKFKPGDITEGKVTRLVSFGAFVELIPGVEGLVHISQMAGFHVKQASEVTREGQMVKVKILDINPEAKRVSLSMREANPRPKKEAARQDHIDPASSLTLGDVFGNLFDRDKGE
jgi:4-hydroxy-3-methylbut-2-enyl diphosphate reductase